jgi:hypothetical protein
VAQPEQTSSATWQNATPRLRVLTVIASVIAIGALPLAFWISRTQDMPIAALQWVALLAGIVALDRPAKAWPRAAWAAKAIAAVYLVSGLLFIAF